MDLSRSLQILILLLLSLTGCAEPKRQITVSAAASLREAFTELADTLRREDPRLDIVFNFAASNVLARQLEAGAPVDVFAPASEELMDSVSSRGLLRTATRMVFAGNELVVVSSPGTSPWSGDTVFSIGMIADQRWALASPGVPVRTYAEQALRRLGVWDRIEKNAVYGANVRQVLDYVANGEASFGIVYRSDALEFRGRVNAYYPVDPSLHQPIRYPVAIMKNAPNAQDAGRFVSCLTSERGRRVLARHGFR